MLELGLFTDPLCKKETLIPRPWIVVPVSCIATLYNVCPGTRGKKYIGITYDCVPLDKNAQFCHYIKLVRLLCLHGGKERHKFGCLLYIVLEILEYNWVIL